MKRIIALLLTVIIIVCSLPITILAETTSNNEAMMSNDENEYIYYSELFYGYSEYLKSYELTRNHLDSQGVMNQAFDEYINSSRFTWAAISKHISLTTNMSELMTAYTDILGLTNVSYVNNLDKANEKFVQALFELKLGNIEEISKDTKCLGQFKKILSTLQKVWKAIYDAKDIDTYDNFIDLAFADLKENCSNLKPLLPSLQTGTYTALSELLSYADDTKEILDLFTAFIVSIGMEEVRLDIINEIIETQSSDTILYEGMTRLYSQLKNGFVQYFIDTYINGKLLESVTKEVSKVITSTIMEAVASQISGATATGLTSLFGAVTASIGLINTIIFEWLWDEPSIEDYQVTMILAQYSDLMYNSIITKQAVFKQQFENDQIEKYETLMDAYSSSITCALDECYNLADDDGIKYAIKQTKNIYGCDFYKNYVNEVKEIILDIPFESRNITDYGVWNMNRNVEAYSASDSIEKNAIYFSDSFKSDISISSGTLTIPKDESVTIQGNVALGKYSLSINNNGILQICGNITSVDGKYSSEVKNINNAGQLYIKGNVTFCSGDRINQNVEGSNVYIGGDFDGYSEYSCKNITAGRMVFNGKTQQTVKNLHIKNISVENPQGIKYLSEIEVYGEYKLNGYPLDNNGFYTRIYNGVSFDQISDYGVIHVGDQVTLTSSVKADIIINSNGITIPKDESVTIQGNVALGKYSLSINNNGILQICGNITSVDGRYSSEVKNINNAGQLYIKGNVTFCSGDRINQNVEGSNVYIGGDFGGYSEYSCKNITAGRMVFDGKTQQTVKNLAAPTIIIENQSNEGVVFESAIKPSVLFDHKGNNFTLYNNGSGSTFVDYDGDGLKDNVDPYPTLHQNCVNGHSYGEWQIRIPATPGNAGVRYKVCSGCNNEITEEIPALPVLSFSGASLTLTDNISVNYKVSKDAVADYSNLCVKFNFGDKVYTIKNYTVSEDYYVFTFNNIAPNQLNQTIFATLCGTKDGIEFESAQVNYSVATYCYNMLDKCTDDKYAEFRTLLVDLLNYGAQSQIYTGYNTDNLANASLTDTQKAWGTSSTPTLKTVQKLDFVTIENPSVLWRGGGLVLDDSVTMRFIIQTDNIENLTVKMTTDNKTYTVRASSFKSMGENLYYVYFYNLNASQMSETVYLTVYNGDKAVSNTLRYSIESYAYAKVGGSDAKLSDLLVAMMKYGNAAYNYVN